MERTQLLAAFAAQLAAVARRQSPGQPAAGPAWPMPAALAAHLWLYACGLTPPTVPPPGTP